MVKRAAARAASDARRSRMRAGVAVERWRAPSSSEASAAGPKAIAMRGRISGDTERRQSALPFGCALPISSESDGCGPWTLLSGWLL